LPKTFPSRGSTPLLNKHGDVYVAGQNRPSKQNVLEKVLPEVRWEKWTPKSCKIYDGGVHDWKGFREESTLKSSGRKP
jgi:hypothetical protein